MANKTINYYNNNAESYYDQTVNIDFEDLYEKFLKYIPDGGSIMDVGCGSGRDAAAFKAAGYAAEGLDASAELGAIAACRQNIKVTVCNMEDWIASEPFDGIWCCASLLHLTEDKCDRFLANLSRNLKSGGVIFISVKTGIKTGCDEKGRYMQNYTETSLSALITEQNQSGNKLKIIDTWLTKDSMNRETEWINMLVVKDKE
jgi:2-polyprenyl-3-methyl-5-hydroxy-6-metoxy-1,4-benzoquinol methylase